ncbi:MAG: efflux RND transporter periplasmic adaptor subunit [Nibricoccus sp.]
MAKSGKFGGTFILLVCIAAAAGAGYYFWKRSDVKPPEVATTTITRGDIVQSITATGVLQAPTSVDVSSQISGQVKEVNADYNQKVKQGDILARIDPATYVSRLNQAKASLASTEANNTLVALNTKRTRDLRAKNLVSEQDLDQAEAQLKQSDAQLLTARASVDDAQVNLDRCTISAPIDGVVLDRQTEVGKMVAASLNAPTLFTLVTDLKTMEISADVAEADIGSVAINQEVTFTVDAYPNRQFHGKVTQIRNLPKTAQSVVVYATIIEVDNSDLRLKPGMTANVSIVIARRTGVLKVANSALRARIPDKFQPKVETPAAATGSASSPGASSGQGGARQGGGNNREQFRQLLQDAGVTFTPGTPLSPADVEKLKKLAAERGIEIPERMLTGGRGGRQGGNDSAVVHRTVYKVETPLPDLKLAAVQARFGISDGSSTEVIESPEGLKENDSLVTSIFVPGDTSAPAAAARSPFGGQQQGFGPGGGGGGGRR